MPAIGERRRKSVSNGAPIGGPLDETVLGDGEALSDQVASVLQRRILVGEIPVGTWLRHGALAEEFGISRTPVREALRILAAHGIVTIAQNRGARVNGQSGQDIREIGEVRAELEGFAAALATDLINDDQLQRLTTAWDRFQAALERPAADQAKAWAEANNDFHSVIVEAAGNPYLAESIAALRRRLPHNISFRAYAGNSRLIERNLEEHAAIVRAIVDHDEGRARQLMAAHIRSSIEAAARQAERAPAGLAGDLAS